MNEEWVVDEDGQRGRWIADPDDPEWEVWEPAKVAAKVDGLEEDLSKKVVVWNDGRGPRRPCQARKTSGEPCQRAAVNGADVCGTHGGRAPQVKRKARLRLEMAADRLARELLGLATGEGVADGVRLAATRDALDRAGLGAKTAVEVEVGPSKPFQQILDAAMGITGGSRAESRTRRGELDAFADEVNPEDAWQDAEIIEAQAEEEDEPDGSPAPRPPEPYETDAGLSEAPSAGLLSMEDALAQLQATPLPPQQPAPRRQGNGH
ncbi:hypothetical protein [Aldersonia kunmingensis]|uniref:hypothetical protein n=1 Tax=Aldersonia kunmingensis TaxID=408066 RepID=UPI00082A377C|nr:hypothetical protein [Aldersonia kunmingensis]